MRMKEVAGAFEQYEKLLRDNESIDFGGLIVETLRLLRDRPKILQKFQNQFKYIIVDEFQDTNWAQYEIVKMLVSGSRNIAVVGDDDQSIYKFRGASISNILQFESDYPDTKRVVLTKNYRSGQKILDAAYSFIAQNNPNRLEVTLKDSHGLSKELKSQVEGEGEVRHMHAETLQEEVQSVVKEIQRIHDEEKADWKDIAILVRANDSANPFAAMLERAQIPFSFLAMTGLYRKPVVLDAVALSRLIDQPHDSASLYRILSHPDLGVSADDLLELSQLARRKGRTLFESMRDNVDKLSQEGVTKCKEFMEFLSEMSDYSKRRNVLEVLALALKKSGLYGSLLTLEEGEQLEQISYLQQFFERVRRFVTVSEMTSLHDFLIEFDHERQAGGEGTLKVSEQAGPDEVKIMTVHGAKGLEFEYVFMVNMVDRRFPSSKRSEPIPLPDGLVKEELPEGDVHLEEERRLFYVGMTRAKKRLYLTSAKDYGGAREKKRSRFLLELGLYKDDVNISSINEWMDAEAKTDYVLKYGNDLPIPNTFSFTQFVAYDHCPLQYKFAHILKIPTAGSWAMSFGKTMHNTLQRFFEALVAGGSGAQLSLLQGTSGGAGARGLSVSKEDLLRMYNRAWIDDWYQDEAQRKEYYLSGQAQLSAYYDHLSENVPRPLFLERGFTVKLDDIVIKGRVDRIDQVEGGVEIIDYKTGSPKTHKTISEPDKLQLYLYQLAAKEIFGLEPVKLTFHYLKDNSELSFLGTEKDIDKLRDTIKKRAEGIRSRTFDPTPGFACRFCDFKDICSFRK